MLSACLPVSRGPTARRILAAQRQPKPCLLGLHARVQQAIRLLQLSTLELQTEVQEALETNPMLETDDGIAALKARTPARLCG